MATSTVGLLKQSISTIRELRADLEAVRRRSHPEPIAIVGMACRFPGAARSPEDYWRVVRDGVTTVVPVPEQRWDADAFYSPAPARPGRSYVRSAHFLEDDVAGFDARFFKMAPVECRSVDPQQRLLLEIVWESLEDAGIDPLSLAGSQTGVYLGISGNSEYGNLIGSVSDVDQYVSTGVVSSVAAGRVCYTLGLNGPAVSVDTACSSSLVAVKLAMDALRQEDCDVALAAGCSLMLAPSVMSSLCAMNALAPDGRSKPFSADADGYGRGEGCGVVVLKRLGAAIDAGDRVWAVLRGAAINNDGESSGLTVPSAHAQRDVLARALKVAEVSPDEIDMLETHGTGTLLGDPIETDAIRSVYGDRQEPLRLGAAKGNIGHLECASGMAGLIKAVLQVYHGEFVPVAGLTEVNPRVGEGRGIAFPREREQWPRPEGRPRRAAVSAFGFSGTNAHVVLEEAPTPPAAAPSASDPVLTLSARTSESLLEQVRRYADFFRAHPDVDLDAVCQQTNLGRALFEHRLLVLPRSVSEAVQVLDEMSRWAEGREDLYADAVEILGTSHGRDRYAARRRLFLTLSDGRALLAHTDDQIPPKFVLALGSDKTDADQQELWARWPGYAEARAVAAAAAQGAGDLADVFSHAYALGTMLRQLGVEPSLVTGCGGGAMAAAVLAGLVDLDSAAGALCRIARGERPGAPRLRSPRVRYCSWEAGAVERDTRAAWEMACADAASGASSSSPLPGIERMGYRFVLLGGVGHLQSARDDVVLLRTGDADGKPEISRVLAQTTALGGSVRWPRGGPLLERGVQLPTYPFQHGRYWLEADEPGPRTLLDAHRFALDGARLDLPGTDPNILHVFSAESFSEAADNSGIVHIGYYMELLSRAASPVLDEGHLVVEWMELLQALVVPPDTPVEVLLSFSEDFPAGTFKIYTREAGGASWASIARGALSVTHDPCPDAPFADDEEAVPFSQEEFYGPLENDKGFYFGPSVRAVVSGRRHGTCGIVELSRADGTPRRGQYALGFHPGFVDACAQAFNRFSHERTPAGQKYMVQRVERVRLWGSTAPDDVEGPRWGRVTVDDIDVDSGTLSGSLSVSSDAGAVQLDMGRVVLKAFDEERIALMTAAQSSQRGVDEALLARFQRSSQEGKVALVLEMLQDLVSEVLGMERAEVSAALAMQDLGLDSMTGMELYTKVSERTGTTLTLTDLLDADNLAGLAQDIAAAMQRHRQDRRGDDAVDTSLSHWLRGTEKLSRPARVRLLCFPNGYRSADMFDGWQEVLGPEIQVLAVQLPGMDASRLREAPPVYVDRFCETLESIVGEALSDLPVATFGHSWGSLFSFRLAHRLRTSGALNVVRAFVSGFTAPNRPNGGTEKVLRELQREGFDRIPQFDEVEGDEHRLNAVVAAYVKAWKYSEAETRATLPQLLAACCLIDRYKHAEGEKLDVPMTVLHGVDDYGVSLAESRAWEDLGAREVNLHVLAGDHQFINVEQSEAQVLEIVRAELLASLPEARPSSESRDEDERVQR